jgi:hypothetical protein
MLVTTPPHPLPLPFFISFFMLVILSKIACRPPLNPNRCYEGPVSVLCGRLPSSETYTYRFDLICLYFGCSLCPVFIMFYSFFLCAKPVVNTFSREKLALVESSTPVLKKKKKKKTARSLRHVMRGKQREKQQLSNEI